MTACSRCGGTPAPNAWHLPAQGAGGTVEWRRYPLCDACYAAVCAVAAGGDTAEIEAACLPPSGGA